jgi:Acyl-CoA carboxylase epsilon subunit
MADEREIRITHGVPTDDELAAIVGVLLLRTVAAPAPTDPAGLSRWAASARRAAARPDGRPARSGGSAWRASALPR